MSIRRNEMKSDKDVRPYLVIVDDFTLTGGKELKGLDNSSEYNREAHRLAYSRQLEQMKQFHLQLTKWISTKGISEDVISLEEPTVPVGSLTLLCTPASASTIEEMPGVKAVIEEP